MLSRLERSLVLMGSRYLCEMSGRRARALELPQLLTVVFAGKAFEDRDRLRAIAQGLSNGDHGQAMLKPVGSDVASAQKHPRIDLDG